MPMIGKPAGVNDFNNVRMGRPADYEQGVSVVENNPDGTSKSQKTGEELNRMAGVKPETRFVDRKQKETMGSDGFMKLLAHQLQHQDPMKPMDQKDFSANLAQFSQLEQMTQMNKKLDAVTNNRPTEDKFYGASFLGKKVITSGTSIDYQGDGRPTEINFSLEKPAKNALVRIYDNKMQLQAQFQRDNLPSGVQTIVWDGYGQDGEIAPKDKYTFEVIAFDQNMNQFKGDTKAEGIVVGVQFENGETVLRMKDGKKVFLRDVQSFSMSDDAPGQKMPALQREATNAYNKVENQLN